MYFCFYAKKGEGLVLVITSLLLILHTLLSPKILGIRSVSFLWPREFLCRPWTMNSSLWNDVMSITRIWDLPCPNRAQSRFTFTSFTFLFPTATNI
jgi:hypothetical protein